MEHCLSPEMANVVLSGEDKLPDKLNVVFRIGDACMETVALSIPMSESGEMGSDRNEVGLT